MQKHYKPRNILDDYIFKVKGRPLFTFFYYFSYETRLNNLHTYLY